MSKTMLMYLIVMIIVTVDNMLLSKTYSVSISGCKGTIKGFKVDNLVDKIKTH